MHLDLHLFDGLFLKSNNYLLQQILYTTLPDTCYFKTKQNYSEHRLFKNTKYSSVSKKKNFYPFYYQ